MALGFCPGVQVRGSGCSACQTRAHAHASEGPAPQNTRTNTNKHRHRHRHRHARTHARHARTPAHSHHIPGTCALVRTHTLTLIHARTLAQTPWHTSAHARTRGARTHTRATAGPRSRMASPRPLNSSQGFREGGSIRAKPQEVSGYNAGWTRQAHAGAATRLSTPRPSFAKWERCHLNPTRPPSAGHPGIIPLLVAAAPLHPRCGPQPPIGRAAPLHAPRPIARAAPLPSASPICPPRLRPAEPGPSKASRLRPSRRMAAAVAAGTPPVRATTGRG